MENTGYLFVHFIGEEKDGEQVYFSLSEDGFHWEDCNGNQPYLYSHIGEGGVRDPFIIRSPWQTGSHYFLIATDLRIESGKGWEAAQYKGSRDLIVWESDNLVDWTGPRACTVGIEGAGCVWAPEAIYDEQKDAILVFWASMVTCSGDKEPKQRIYASYTKDFRTFSEPFIYLEHENHVIDTTIIHTAEGYYRFSKDETTKNIQVDFGKSLDKDCFHVIKAPVLNSLFGVEGPEIYKLNDREEWCLIVDRFATHQGYLPLVTKNLASGDFRILEECEFDMGKTRKRHGGILNLTKEEYERLQQIK